MHLTYQLYRILIEWHPEQCSNILLLTHLALKEWEVEDETIILTHLISALQMDDKDGSTLSINKS